MSVATGARSSFEKFILDRQKEIAARLGKKDYQITPEEYDKAVVEFFGEIPLPGNATEVSRTPTELIYKDNTDGRTYKIFRNTDSNLGVNTGKLETSLQQIPGAPAGSLISPQSGAKEQDFAAQLLGQLNNYFQSTFAGNQNQSASETVGANTWLDRLFANAETLQEPTTLANLDPEAKASLDAILASTLGQLDQQFSDQSGELTANLFGRGVNRSSIAGSEANRLLQGQGLVKNQALSDAASRELGLRQFISQLTQGNRALAGEQLAQGAGLETNAFREVTNRGGQGIGLLESLLGQALNRETAGVQLGQQQQQITNQAGQFDKQLGLSLAQFEQQAAAQRAAENRARIGQIVSTIAAIGLAPLTGGTSLIGLASGGLGKILGGGGGATTPPWTFDSGSVVPN